MAGPTAVARSPSSSPAPHELSAEDLPPLAYDSEPELLEMFERWRDELRADVKRKWLELGGTRGKQSLEEAEKHVMEVCSLDPVSSL